MLVAAHYLQEHERYKIQVLERRRIELRGQLKNTEKMLVETIDKELYKTIKSVVLREMKHEIQALRNDEKGCTDKCRLKSQVNELDLERH